jgi:hypothetical protein
MISGVERSWKDSALPHVLQKPREVDGDDA